MQAIVATVAIWFYVARKPDPFIARPLNFLLSKIPGVAWLWGSWLDCAFCGGCWIASGVQIAFGWTLLPTPPFSWAFSWALFSTSFVNALAVALCSAIIVALVDLLRQKVENGALISALLVEATKQDEENGDAVEKEEPRN